MVSLSLVEIKTMEGKNRQQIIYNASSTVSQVKDVTDKFTQGNYKLKSSYTIFFLYDFNYDCESREFIITYGGKIHNHSSLNITILTYFDPHMVSHWSNVQFREALILDEKNRYNNVMRVINEIKSIYQVKTLPAIVIVKKEKNGKEKSFNINLTGYKKESIYSTFREIMDIINDNCEEDFLVIAKKILGSSFKQSQENSLLSFNTFDYIKDLVKAKNKTMSYGYTQDDLAAKLGISIRGLRNKRSNNSFTRDECLFIAIEFNISVNDLNLLLENNNHIRIGMEGRDGLIRRCLFDKYDIDKTNDQLELHGYSKLNVVLDD